MTTESIPGYTFGSEELARSPVSLDELALLEQTLLFTDDDVAALRMSGEVLADQVEDILDVWYGFVGDNPHLLAAFAGRETGEPLGDYLDRVRARFGQWIRDTAAAEYDQAWLDYQHEIGRRHHRVGKNTADEVDATDHIPLRYVLALHQPITATLRPFLANGGHSDEQVEAMHRAWEKSVLLHLILWTRSYVATEDW